MYLGLAYVTVLVPPQDKLVKSQASLNMLGYLSLSCDSIVVTHLVADDDQLFDGCRLRQLLFHCACLFAACRDEKEASRTSERGPYRWRISRVGKHFLDAALIFALCMHIAAVARYSTVIRYPTEHYSVYGL